MRAPDVYNTRHPGNGASLGPKPALGPVPFNCICGIKRLSADTRAPSLQILSPKAGEDVSAPFSVRILISGIDSAILARLNLRLTVDNPPFYTAVLPIDGSQRSATMPDDKMLSGRRDLVFSLARPDGAPMAASRASVVVAGVTIS